MFQNNVTPLRAYTSSCAYAEFSEREKGTLEPGKLADIVVLSQDIFHIPPEDIPKTRVVYTIVGGRQIWRGSWDCGIHFGTIRPQRIAAPD
jgi:predicted amidohydrolase YtcJ